MQVTRVKRGKMPIGPSGDRLIISGANLMEPIMMNLRTIKQQASEIPFAFLFLFPSAQAIRSIISCGTRDN